MLTNNKPKNNNNAMPLRIKCFFSSHHQGRRRQIEHSYRNEKIHP